MEFAIQTAEALNCKLLVLNVIDFMEKMVGLKSVNKVIQEDAIYRLDKFIAPYKKKSPVPILSKIARGEPYTVITRQAEINEVDLIILGAQGEDSTDNYFLGKVAGSIIKFKEIPVIAVPKFYESRRINNILFLFKRLNKSIFDILPPLLELTDAYQSKIHAVHVTGAQTGPVAYSPDLIFEHRQYDYKDLQVDTLFEAITDQFSKASYDLLCIIKRKRGLLEQIFEASPTPKSIIDSPVPVLFLNDDE